MQRSKLNWIEIVGLLPSSLFLGKFLLIGLVAMMFVLWSWATQAPQAEGGWRFELKQVAPVLLLIGSALAGLVGVWMAVLRGAERLRRKTWQRWGVLLCLVAGMGAAGYWLRWMATQARNAMPSGSWGWSFWSVLLVPPIVVGTHQLCLLIRPADQPETATADEES